MHQRSALSRFISVFRNFGLGVALKVTTLRVRGVLLPASAAPGPPSYDDPRRELSLLIDAALHDAVALQGIIEALAKREQSNWEICVCEHPPVQPSMQRALSRFRGLHPWIRIVSTDPAVDKSTAARWTVEQATGKFVAVLAPQWTFDADAATELLAQMKDEPLFEAAMLFETHDGPVDPANPGPWGDCRMMAQVKSGYLAAVSGSWPLTAPALAEALNASGARIAIVAARDKLNSLGIASSRVQR